MSKRKSKNKYDAYVSGYGYTATVRNEDNSFRMTRTFESLAEARAWGREERDKLNNQEEDR